MKRLFAQSYWSIFIDKLKQTESGMTDEFFTLIEGAHFVMHEYWLYFRAHRAAYQKTFQNCPKSKILIGWR